MENSAKILDNECERYCEIYLIRNIVNLKCYIGQTVSHVLNHRRYRPYGSIMRFRHHVSEAYSDKDKQCRYLNNAIRKYGPQNFEVTILATCNTEDANTMEIFYIDKECTLFPNGYNLTTGGKQFTATLEMKEKLSKSVCAHFEQKKIERFSNIHQIPTDTSSCIRPLRREGKQYGWYVYIEKKKADFGGVHIPLEESRIKAEQFIDILREKLATCLDAGNPLESSTTTS